ncbi:MAG: DUF5666 domain-containing protein [Chloroflexi bacterium]|nr:DUF5666 domain-containing protein [Chloroflexota bacterium]
MGIMGIKWSGKVLVVLLAVAALVLGIGGDLVLTRGAPLVAKVAAATGHEIATGVVSNVSGSEITVKNRQGQTTVIVVDPDAWIFVGGKEAGLDAIKVNTRLSAAGTKGADGKLAAKFVFDGSKTVPATTARRPLAGRLGIGYGEVVSLNGNTLTVKQLNGNQQTVTLTDQTIIEQPNGKDLTRDALTPGTKVLVRATRTNNNLQAQRIIVLPQDFNPGAGRQHWQGQQAPNNPHPGFRMGPGRFRGNGRAL